MRYNNLRNYYETHFNLKAYYNWSMTEIERLYPFERDIYLALIKNDEAKRAEEQQKKSNRLF